jgi:hypothetical protein
MSLEDIKIWLIEKKMPMEVVEAFEDNDMDGDALVTLIGLTPGPDSLKDLVTKVGQRLKLYKEVKALYDQKVNVVNALQSFMYM